MGLAVAFGIVSNHGGSIGVTSKLDHGAQFTVELPLCDHPCPTLDKQTPSPSLPRQYDPKSKRILVVDDEQTIRQLCQRLLPRLGWQVTSAESGEAALRLFEDPTFHCDAVLMDMTMPGLNGLETFQALRARQPDLQIVVCTGHAADADVQHILSQGGAGFIQKPFSISTIRTTLDHL